MKMTPAHADIETQDAIDLISEERGRTTKVLASTDDWTDEPDLMYGPAGPYYGSVLMEWGSGQCLDHLDCGGVEVYRRVALPADYAKDSAAFLLEELKMDWEENLSFDDNEPPVAFDELGAAIQTILEKVKPEEVSRYNPTGLVLILGH